LPRRPHGRLTDGAHRGRGWSDAWTSSEEGLAYLETRPYYFVRLQPDGTFLVSGVAAGQYELALKLYEPPADGCLVHPIATKVVPFEVSEKEAAATGRLDLGNIPVEAMPTLQPGDSVPDFEFETIDGKKNSLADLRGQHVLLSFWATWCGACVQQLPALEELHREHADGGELTMVSLNLDADREAARQFIIQRKFPWLNACLGDWSATPIPTQFGVGSAPTYFLITPDGTLAHRGYNIAETKEKLSATLNQSGPTP